MLSLQANVTGPAPGPAPACPGALAHGAAASTVDCHAAWDAWAVTELSADGEDVVGKAALPQYLVLGACEDTAPACASNCRVGHTTNARNATSAHLVARFAARIALLEEELAAFPPPEVDGTSQVLGACGNMRMKMWLVTLPAGPDAAAPAGASAAQPLTWWAARMQRRRLSAQRRAACARARGGRRARRCCSSACWRAAPRLCAPRWWRWWRARSQCTHRPAFAGAAVAACAASRRRRSWRRR